MPKDKKPSSGKTGHRSVTVKVKSARGRKSSSTRWLQRQLNDPYVQRAHEDGYRSRAAYKLIQIHEKLELFKPGMKVVDLGAAPGSWSQIAMEYIKPKGEIVGIDLLAMEPMAGATFIQGDFLSQEVYEELLELVDDKLDVVMSDMSPSTTGHKQTDHLRIVALVEAAAQFAFDHLKEGGVFVSKVFQGGADGDLLKELKLRFEKVKHIKPEASRKESPETYLIATGFKG